MREINNNPEWIGKKFGRLTVVGFRKVKNGENHAWAWDCKCDCGNIVYGIRPRNVKSGQTASCGCLKKEQNIHNLAEKRRTHGKTNTRLYGVWCHIKERCKSPNCPAYKNYGGRGICVCDEWDSDFQAFYDWALENGYKDGLTIERIDVNGDYCPGNCCWITFDEQQRNKRNIRVVEIEGEKVTLKEACRRLNLPYKAVDLRVTRYGMSIEEAISTPFVDKSKSLAQKCKDHGLPYGTILARVKSGWSEERALLEPIHRAKRHIKK